MRRSKCQRMCGKSLDWKPRSQPMRDQAFQCTLGVVTVSLGAMVPAAGFAIALPAGILGLHRTLKSLDSTFRTFMMVRNGFEKNMCAAESCYQRAGAVVKTMGAKLDRSVREFGRRSWVTSVILSKKSVSRYGKGDLLGEKAANDVTEATSTYYRVKVCQRK